MTNPELIDRIILQGHALVRAIEVLGTIQPSGPFERAPACLLMAAYKRGCWLGFRNKSSGAAALESPEKGLCVGRRLRLSRRSCA